MAIVAAGLFTAVVGLGIVGAVSAATAAPASVGTATVQPNPIVILDR